MESETAEGGRVPRSEASHTVRLPGFIADEPVGLGDVIKRATTRAATRPCGGCEQRAQRLNRWIAFSGRRQF